MTNHRSSLRKAARPFGALMLACATMLTPAGMAGAAPDSSAAKTDSGVILMSVGASRVINLPGAMTIVIPKGGPVPPFLDQFNKRQQ